MYTPDKTSFQIPGLTQSERIAEGPGMQLQGREQLFLDIFEHAPIGINLTSPDGKSIRTNRALKHFLGYTNKEMYGQMFTNWAHPDDVAQSIQLVQRFHAGECDSGSFEKRYIRKDGKIVWGYTTLTALRNARGNIDYVIAFVDDITDRKEANKHIKLNNKLLFEVNRVHSLSETLQLCLETAIVISEMDCGGIYLFDENGGLKLSESKGFSETFMEGARYYEADTPNTRLVMAGNSVYSRHSDLERALTGPDSGEALRAIAIIPIVREDHIIGCMNVASHTIEEIPKRNRGSLETITSVMGLIISRARSNASLQESEALLRTVFDNSRDGKVIVARDGRFVMVNQAATELTGYTKNELLGMSPFDFYGPQDVPVIRDYIQRAMDGEDMRMDIKIRRKDGTEIDAEFNNTRILINGTPHLYAAGRDVSVRKKLEKELKDSVSLLENIYACLDEAVIVVDPRTSVIISANTAAGNIFGYPVEDLIGRTSEFLHVNRRQYQEFKSMLMPNVDSEGTFNTEINMQKKDGTVFPADITIKETLDDSESCVIHVSVLRDITEQKKTISALENREKDLKEKSVHLEELNVALKVLLDQREKEKNKIEESFSGSVSELIVPYLERIRKTDLDELQMEYINILELNLREIIRPFKHRVSDKLTRLSPMETRIVNHLRQGYVSKEIASMLNISPRTVEFHRDNIRKKLGLKNRKVNLQTYLAGLP